MSADDALADWATASPLMDRINDLAERLAGLCRLVEQGSHHVPGAALDAAHALLCLAVATAADEDEQTIRQETVSDAMPVLARLGLGHIEALVAAALSHDVVAGRLARGVDRLQ